MEKDELPPKLDGNCDFVEKEGLTRGTNVWLEVSGIVISGNSEDEDAFSVVKLDLNVLSGTVKLLLPSTLMLPKEPGFIPKFEASFVRNCVLPNPFIGDKNGSLCLGPGASKKVSWFLGLCGLIVGSNIRFLLNGDGLNGSLRESNDQNESRLIESTTSFCAVQFKHLSKR